MGPLCKVRIVIAPVSVSLEGLNEFRQVRLLALVWPRVSAQSVLTRMMIMVYQSLHINDLTPFNPHHCRDAIIPFEG